MSVVRSAVLLSLGLHVAAGWWLLKSAEHVRMSQAQPSIDQRRLQVTLLTIVTQPGLLPPNLAPAPRFEQQLNSQPPKAQAAQTSRLAAQRESGFPISAAAALDSNTPPKPTSPAAVEASSHTVQPRLELSLGAAAQATERQRRQSPLASAVDAQQMQTGAAKIASAFSRLDPVSSNIVEETITADGGRVIRFSGGGCMRMPNPSARSNDDIRKPVMENC